MSIPDKNICITNTGTVISPYIKGQCEKIESDTSVWNKVYYKREPVIGFIIEPPNTEIHEFVTCKNSEEYLKNLFPGYSVTYMPKIKIKSIPQEFELNDDVTPTDIQSNTINEILSHKKCKEWFVNLQTGYGKTLLSIYLISILGVKSMILCYSTEILSQWIKTIQEKTTFDPSRILTIDSSKLLYSIYEGKFDTENYDMFMVTPRLIVVFCERYGFNLLQKTFNILGIGIKVFDEAHRNIGNMIKINGYSNVEKTLYLSADFSQANRIKEKLYYKMMYGVPVFKPSKETMNDLKYTQAMVIEYDSDPTIEDSVFVYSKFGFSSANYMRYQFGTKIMYDALYYILDAIFKMNANKYRILILVNLLEHIDILDEKLSEKYGASKIIGRFHSKLDQPERDLTKQTADIILSTYQSFGTGLNVDNIKFVISIDQCNKVWDNQAAGRARPLPDGSDAYYVMLVDKGFKYSVNKLKSRLNYLNDTKIKKITRIKYYPIS